MQQGGVHIHTPAAGAWAVCLCGNTGAMWEDPQAGKLVIATRGDKSNVLALGLNNQLLVRAIQASGRGQAWQDYRDWHDIATDAPGYVFDKSRAACWAVIYKVGTTSDTRWANEEELAVFLKALS